MKQPMWDSKAVKAYETGQGVELVNEPYPHYVPINKQGVENMTEEDEEFKRIERRIEIETQPLINFTKEKEWVGLTVDEIAELVCNLEDPENRIELGQKIIAKLKEKNT